MWANRDSVKRAVWTMVGRWRPASGWQAKTSSRTSSPGTGAGTG